MALTSTGLNGGGLTTNFRVQYENTLPNQAAIIANANSLLGIIENEFAVTTGWFNTPAGSFGASNRQIVNLNIGGGGGGNNGGYGSAINIDSLGSGPNPLGSLEMVFMNEWVEILMSRGGVWNAGDSNGEGLSQYCGIVRFQAGHYSYYGSWVNTWLNTIPRQDWVNSTKPTDADAISFGCSLAFIYYLNVQLGFSINQIIAAYNANLANTYRTLTGDTGNPYPFFMRLLENVYPSSSSANIPGPISDNPFPLGLLSFWVDKNTFGKDEVQDVINTNAGTFPKAFWLVVEGYNINAFNSFSIANGLPSNTADFTGTFAGINGISINRNTSPTAISFEFPTNPNIPQRIRVAYDITFTDASLLNTIFPATGDAEYVLNASIKIGGNAITGSQAAAEFELVSGADPYFTNIDPNQNNVFWLSQDLRVFTATPALNNTPIAGGPVFNTDSVQGAFNYLQQLIPYLNSTFNNPTGTDPFNSILPGQLSAYTEDSSVSQVHFDFSNPFNPQFYNNYNFAIARVRLRGIAGTTTANNVKAFFRLWSSQTADTDYQPSTTYLSNNDGTGKPQSPQMGAGNTTIPFFASGNLSSNSDYSVGGINNQNIQLIGNDYKWAYFGCFLNLYDSTNIINGQQIQNYLNGTHHCIVAQIAYDNAPIVNSGGITESPESSDKLAQRNLQLTFSDNPGIAATHRIPQTFDTRPSNLLVASGDMLLSYPDELMIDWGNTPEGSTASIYWPRVSANDLISLANKIYGTHTLYSTDANTIQCKVTNGVTYIPIPPDSGDNFAGLFTVDLPTTVVSGQEFNIIVKRISSKQAAQQHVIGTPPSFTHTPKSIHDTSPANANEPTEMKMTVRSQKEINWRYVTGTFQVKIPVTTKEVMLFPEENTLAIMKWRLQTMSPANRWYPVLQRYIAYISARIDGLGGNSYAIKASPQGITPKTKQGSVDKDCECTKIKTRCLANLIIALVAWIGFWVFAIKAAMYFITSGSLTTLGWVVLIFSFVSSLMASIVLIKKALLKCD